MRKLLLGCLLLFSSFICVAQGTFVRKYTSLIAVKNNIKDEWIKADITVVFNPKGIADIVFYYPNGITKRFHQINNPKKDKTTNGDEYQIVQCLNESGEEMAIQLFDDDTCLRVIVAEGYYVEFHKD